MRKLIKSKPLKVLLCTIMLFSLLTPSASVYAADNTDIQPYATVIDNYSLGIKISGITAKCEASMQADYSTTLRITMELQKATSSGYENVQTWTSSKTGYTLSVSESKVINVLSDYRLKVTFTAGTESKVAYDYA